MVEVAEVNPEGGRIARFDNDLYLGVFRWGSSGPWNNVLETDFCLFVGPDLRAMRPPVEVLNRIRVRRPGYGVWPLGGILGPSTIRQSLRRVQLELAANVASLGCIATSRGSPSSSGLHPAGSGPGSLSIRKGGTVSRSEATAGTRWVNGSLNRWMVSTASFPKDPSCSSRLAWTRTFRHPRSRH